MELSLVGEMIGYAVTVVAGVLGLYLIFCWLFVWESRSSPGRLTDIGWKKVDYGWIFIGSMGLVLQFIQVGLDSKLATLKTEKTFGQLDAQTLNIAAEELSDESICLQASSSNDGNNSNDLAVELADACRKFRIIRPVELRSTVVDMNIFRYFKIVYFDADKIKSPLLAAKVKNFKRAFLEYEQQSQTIQDAIRIARAYEKYLFFLKVITTILLVVAVALRLAKVTGEIRLKTNPIERKCTEAAPAGKLKRSDRKCSDCG